MPVTVASLHVYPLKGARGTDLTTATLTPRGVRHDRELMLVDLAGRFISQRTDPRLALLRPDYDGRTLRVRAPDGAELVHEIRPDGARRQVSIQRSECTGVDQGDGVADWFGAVLGRQCRLVRFPDDARRAVPAEYGGGEMGYPDTLPLLVLSQESLDELNLRLDTPLPMNRFRPNLVVTGWGAPFTEDRIAQLRIGQVRIDLVRPCGRCEVTTVDQDTAVRGREPLVALAGFRRVDQRLLFGMHGVPRELGTLRVGDPVEAWERDAA